MARRYLYPLAAALLLLVAWHWAVRLSGTKIFPGPAEVARGLVQLGEKQLLWRYLRDSLLRVATGYTLAVLTGVPFGILLGWYPRAAKAAGPLIQILRPISPLAWMPLAVIWFGISNAAPIFLIFLAAFFPSALAAMNAVREIPPMVLQAGRNFGLTTPQLFRRIVIPAILPRLLGGLRIAFGIAWLVLVAAEMIAVDSGLGYLIIDARNAGKRYDLVVGGMLVIGATGLLLDVLFRRVERLPRLRWGFSDVSQS